MKQKDLLNIKNIAGEPTVTIAQIDENGLELYIEQLKDVGCMFVTDDDGNIKAVMVSCEVYEAMQQLTEHIERY